MGSFAGCKWKSLHHYSLWAARVQPAISPKGNRCSSRSLSFLSQWSGSWHGCFFSQNKRVPPQKVVVQQVLLLKYIDCRGSTWVTEGSNLELGELLESSYRSPSSSPLSLYQNPTRHKPSNPDTQGSHLDRDFLTRKKALLGLLVTGEMLEPSAFILWHLENNVWIRDPMTCDEEAVS